MSIKNWGWGRRVAQIPHIEAPTSLAWARSSGRPQIASDHSDPMMCYDMLWPHILEYINVHHRIKSAVFHPTFLTCGFYSVVLEIFSIHSTAGTVFPRDYRRLRQWRSLLAMVFQGSILQWFEKGGKHWQTQRDETVSQKSPPQKKKDIYIYNIYIYICGITFFLKTGDLDSLRLSFLTWTEIKESQVMQSRPGGPDLWSTHLLPPIFDRWLHLRWKQTLPEPWAFIVQKFSEKFWSSFHRLIPMVSQPLASQKLGRTLDCGWLNQSRHCEDDPVLKLTEIET